MPRKRTKNWEEIIDKNSKCKLLEIPKRTNDKTQFKCFCGNLFKTTMQKVASGHTTSCGCNRGRKFQGTENICQDFYGRLIRNAKIRNIEVTISIEDIENKLKKQNYTCALTNRELIFGKTSLCNYTASVDRINSKKGYTKENIQILHKDVNMCKQSLSNTEFKKLCQEVANKI